MSFSQISNQRPDPAHDRPSLATHRPHRHARVDGATQLRWAGVGGWGWGGLLVELKKKVVFRASLSIDRRKKQKDENESCNSLSH